MVTIFFFFFFEKLIGNPVSRLWLSIDRIDVIAIMRPLISPAAMIYNKKPFCGALRGILH